MRTSSSTYTVLYSSVIREAAARRNFDYSKPHMQRRRERALFDICHGASRLTEVSRKYQLNDRLIARDVTKVCWLIFRRVTVTADRKKFPACYSTK